VSGPEGLTPAGAKSARDGRQCDAAEGENRQNHDAVTWRVGNFQLRPETGQAAIGVAQDAEIVSRSSLRTSVMVRRIYPRTAPESSRTDSEHRAIGRETPRGASSKARQPCVLIDPEKNGGFQTESRYFRRGLATKAISPDCPDYEHRRISETQRRPVRHWRERQWHAVSLSHETGGGNRASRGSSPHLQQFDVEH
jgi:hypothetical protein